MSSRSRKSVAIPCIPRLPSSVATWGSIPHLPAFARFPGFSLYSFPRSGREPRRFSPGSWEIFSFLFRPPTVPGPREKRGNARSPPPPGWPGFVPLRPRILSPAARAGRAVAPSRSWVIRGSPGRRFDSRFPPPPSSVGFFFFSCGGKIREKLKGRLRKGSCNSLTRSMTNCPGWARAGDLRAQETQAEIICG